MRENGTEQNGMHALNDSDRDDRAGNRDEGNIPTVFLPLVLGPYSIAKYKWVPQMGSPNGLANYIVVSLW